MSQESIDRRERPFTHVVGIDQAMETLDYREMVALAGLFEHWALNDVGLNGDQQTWFLQLAVDYERIAKFCGEGWTASDHESPPGLIAFIAQRALSHPRDGSNALQNVPET